MKKNNAFTLIELLVVIVIIGILATISVVAYGGYQEKARIAKAQAFAKDSNIQMLAAHTEKESSMFGHWNFDGSDPNVAIDYSGEGHNLVKNTTNITLAERVLDTPTGIGLATRAISNYYVYHDPSGTTFNVADGGGVTLNGWFKVEDFSSASSILLFANNKYHLRIYNNGVIKFGVNTENGLKDITTPSNSFKHNKWYFVLATYDEDRGLMKIYLDGELVKKDTHSGKIIEFPGTNLAYTYGNTLLFDDFYKWTIPYRSK